MTGPRQPVLELDRVSKHFGAAAAVDRVSFTVSPGEFFSILGPSGSGKTTTLRLIAGFEIPDPDGGVVRIEGQAVNDRRPYERPLSMVFQGYALFPHLSVERNVRFGLEQHQVSRHEIPDRVRRALELVRLAPAAFASRMPSDLSGGERQRVALARALVLEPAILLLDEPLGALDLKLRKEMQRELKRLNRQLGITFVYVTHDQEEALTMSDRIAVMANARLIQVGTPAEIYDRPRTAFAARFIGESNVFPGTAGVLRDGLREVALSFGPRVLVPEGHGVLAGRAVEVAIRPERLVLREGGSLPAGLNGFEATVEELVFLGDVWHVRIRAADGTPATVAIRHEGQREGPFPWRVGDASLVIWDPGAGHLLEGDDARPS